MPQQATAFPGSMSLTTTLINSAVPSDLMQLATTLSNEIAELRLSLFTSEDLQIAAGKLKDNTAAGLFMW